MSRSLAMLSPSAGMDGWDFSSSTSAWKKKSSSCTPKMVVKPAVGEPSNVNVVFFFHVWQWVRHVNKLQRLLFNHAQEEAEVIFHNKSSKVTTKLNYSNAYYSQKRRPKPPPRRARVCPRERRQQGAAHQLPKPKKSTPGRLTLTLRRKAKTMTTLELRGTTKKSSVCC